MDQIGSSGKACRAARCGASGKRHKGEARHAKSSGGRFRGLNGGPIWPTGGRVLLPRGRRCVSYPMPHIALRNAPSHGTREPGQSGSELPKRALDYRNPFSQSNRHGPKSTSGTQETSARPAKSVGCSSVNGHSEGRRLPLDAKRTFLSVIENGDS